MYMCRPLEPDFSWDDLYVTGDVLENERISPPFVSLFFSFLMFLRIDNITVSN